MCREIELAFDWGGLRLAGSLHLPPEAGSHPAVLMAQGSGPADRNSDGYLKPIRQTFIDQGIATFAFDKPGCGESSGDWRNYGLQARTEQMVAALELVRDHPTVTPERVGIWGHSQGGWLVQKLAGQIETLAFAIACSGPSIGVQEQVIHSCEQLMRNHGCDQTQIQSALALTQALLHAAAEGADFETISDQLLTPASLKPWFENYPTIDGPSDWQHFKLLANEPNEPLANLERVTCPFLAIYGGLDTLLPPWRGAQETGRALAAAASPDTTVAVFPLGDHRIQHPDTPEFVDGYLQLLGSWTASRAR